jgi:hypothetical protein
MKRGAAFLLRAATSAALLSAALAQEPPRERGQEPQVPDLPQPRSGIGITGLSVYGQGISPLGNGDHIGQPWSGSLFAVGGTADLGWHSFKQTRVATLDYHLAGDWNPKWSQMNGFDHTVNLAIRTDQENRVSFALSGVAEQRRLSNMLFDPLTAAQISLSRTNADFSNAMGDMRDTGTVFTPAVELWMFGQNLRRAAGRFSLSYRQSRRVSWYSTVSAERTLPISPDQKDFPGAFYFGGLSSASAGGGVQVSLSRRTSFGLSAFYGRTDSSPLQTWSLTAGANVTRRFSEHAVGYLSGGYDHMVEFAPVTHPPIHSYYAAAGLGFSRGQHSLVLLANTGLTSRYGTGVQRSNAGQFIWTASTRNRLWTASTGVSYQQLTGGGLATSQGWNCRFDLSRRLGRQFNLTAQAVYAGINYSRLGNPRANVLLGRVELSWTSLRFWR